MFCPVQRQDNKGHAIAVFGIADMHFNSSNSRTPINDFIGKLQPSGMPDGIAFAGKNLKCGKEPHDFLLARLAASANAVLRQALEALLVDKKCGRGPQVPENVMIKMLQSRRHDEIAPTAEKATGLRPAQRLAAGKGHEIRALCNEPLEICLWRQLCRRINDDGNPARVGNSHHLGKRRPCLDIGHIKNRRRALGNGIVNLPGFRIADPAPA